MRKDILEKKEEILEWINDNQPKSFICKELICRQSTLNGYLKKMNIEYNGNMGLKGKKISNNRKHVSKYLFNGSLISSNTLRKKLIMDGYKEKKCEICNLTEWNNKDAPLEIHHIDGNRFNNEFNNIQILCPNCHAQTNTYCKSLNQKSKINKNPQQKCECGNKKQENSKYCMDCSKLKQRKVKRPSYDKLLKEIKEFGYRGTGRKYGVSDNSIRKWKKNYEKAK